MSESEGRLPPALVPLMTVPAMARLKPLAKERRHPVDYRDELEHEAVVAILSDLPDDHIATYAYYTAARSAADSLSMTHMIAERPDLVARLIAAYTAHAGRINAKGNSTGVLASSAGSR